MYKLYEKKVQKCSTSNINASRLAFGLLGGCCRGSKVPRHLFARNIRSAGGRRLLYIRHLRSWSSCFADSISRCFSKPRSSFDGPHSLSSATIADSGFEALGASLVWDSLPHCELADGFVQLAFFSKLELFVGPKLDARVVEARLAIGIVTIAGLVDVEFCETFFIVTSGAKN